MKVHRKTQYQCIGVFTLHIHKFIRKATTPRGEVTLMAYHYSTNNSTKQYNFLI